MGRGSIAASCALSSALEHRRTKALWCRSPPLHATDTLRFGSLYAQVFFNTRPTASQQPPFRHCHDRAVRPGPSRHAPCKAAATWLSRLVWERFLLLLTLPPAAVPIAADGTPERMVLWEQDLWNDVLRSVEDDVAIHPYAYGRSSATPEARARWHAPSTLSYTRRAYSERFLARRRLGRPLHSPLPPPSDSEAPPESLARGVRFLPLCAPHNLSTTRDAGQCLRGGRLLFAPPWLASLATEPMLSWSVGPPAQSAYVHLVGIWRCAFARSCFSKASRIWWLKANGLWDTRLDALPPHIAPPLALGTPPLRRRFGRSIGTSNASSDAVPAATANGAHVVARDAVRVLSLPLSVIERVRDVFELHRLLHNLLTIASLLGLTPRIPRLACALFANWTLAVNESADDLNAHERAADHRPRSLRPFSFNGQRRFGVGAADVIVRASGDNRRCMLFPAGASCTLQWVDYEFDDTEDDVALQRPLPALTLPPRLDAISTAAERLGAVCNAMRGATATAMWTHAELHGLDPQSSLLVDGVSPTPRPESIARSSRHWRARAELLADGAPGMSRPSPLRTVCPGTRRWLQTARECPHYFLQDEALVWRSIAAATLSRIGDAARYKET